MKGKLFLTFWIFWALPFANAQSTPDSNFTLQQCIDYALKNQTNVVNAELDKQIAEGKIRETRAMGYPQITGTAQVLDNPQLSRMYFSPKNPFAQSFKDPTTGQYYPTVKQSGDVLVSKNLFQLRDAGDANATLNQLIFNGSYIVGLQAAKTYRVLAQKSIVQSKIQTIENVIKAYYLVLINKERINLFDVNLQRLDSAISQSNALNKSGYIENIDVSRLEVQYNNTLTDKQNFDNMYQLSLILLKFQMGMPIEESINLSENISSINFDLSADSNQTFDYTQRIEYSLLKTQESLQALDLKRLRYSRLPSISAFGRYGINRQDVAFGNLFTHSWFPYNMIGLNLSIPILDLRSQYQAQQAKLTVKKTKNSLNNFKNAAEVEVESSKLNYFNSLKVMQNQKRNMELAQQVARVTKIKYNEGVGSNLEVVNAESDLKQAQINYYQAFYDALVSQINYKKATGTLYNGQ